MTHALCVPDSECLLPKLDRPVLALAAERAGGERESRYRRRHRLRGPRADLFCKHHAELFGSGARRAVELLGPFSIAGDVASHQDLGEIMLAVGRPGPCAPAFVDLDGRGQMRHRVIEASTGRRKQAQIAIDGTNASLT